MVWVESGVSGVGGEWVGKGVLMVRCGHHVHGTGRVSGDSNTLRTLCTCTNIALQTACL